MLTQIGGSFAPAFAMLTTVRSVTLPLVQTGTLATGPTLEWALPMTRAAHGRRAFLDTTLTLGDAAWVTSPVLPGLAIPRSGRKASGAGT